MTINLNNLKRSCLKSLNQLEISGDECMITIWNQREVFIGNPSVELKSTVDTLSANKIKYKCRVFSDSSVHFLNTTIASLGIFISKDDSSKIYYVYVHKKEYAKALAVLGNK